MKNKGFTLVELMIVVTILGILAAIVLPEFQGHASESRESGAKSTLHTVRCQIELYKMQHDVKLGYVNSIAMTGDYVITQLTGTTAANGTASSSQVASATYPYGPYISEMAINPFNNLSTIKVVGSAVTDFSTQVDGTTGWLFQKESGTFKLNYSGTDSEGTAYVDY